MSRSFAIVDFKPFCFTPLYLLYIDGRKFLHATSCSVAYYFAGRCPAACVRSIVGELDEELDANLDLSKLRAHPLKPVDEHRKERVWRERVGTGEAFSILWGHYERIPSV
ncbi:unnamed protein product [Ilex paraguariensis]|uniref:Uncharacterized protein n=1 Tax=Ilex paraguariensis TaxID=185542 RepID=A0ABC8QVF9_9AQUA